MDLSIVTTLYRSAPYIQEFYQRMSAAASQLTADYEMIFVNDGSPDDALERAIALHEQDTRVKVVDLSRNFGHHKAMMTGLAQAQGRWVFLIDSDLEEEPELLGQFHQQLLATQADVVYGVQTLRKGNWFEQWTGKLFYRLFNLLSSYPIPANLVTARLMTQRYVRSLVEHRDREIFLAGLWAITGYKQVAIAIKKHSKNSSTYTLRHKLAVLINSITSFSNKPLIAIFYLGCGILLIASLAALNLIIQRLVFGIYLTGWPSIIVSIWLLGGLTIFCIGLVGVYLSKVFTETKDRPYTVIRQIYQHSPQPDQAIDRPALLATVDAYYTQKLSQHGPNAQGVDWNSSESQALRFTQLLQVCQEERYSLLDFGCGYGALQDYLQQQHPGVADYYGFDISEAMIECARTRYEGRSHCTFFSASEQLKPVDYVVASGIFNVKMNHTDAAWEQYVLQTLMQLNQLSQRGFAFNILTRYSDPEYQRSDLYYADPCFFFDFCKQTFSKNVALLHDYGLYEFTLLVRK